MGELCAQLTAFIAADPAKVYAAFADYRGAHAKIVPPEFFSGYEVLKGGRGAGTVVAVRVRMLGQVRALRMEVSEPDPGRVLMETETTSGMRTTFSVAPANGGTNVTIATRWQSQKGFAGIIEGWIVPRILRTVYAEELKLLAGLFRP